MSTFRKLNFRPRALQHSLIQTTTRSVPLKATNDVDLIKTLLVLLSARSFSVIEKHDEDDLRNSVVTLNSLRQSGTSKGIDKQDSCLEVMIK